MNSINDNQIVKTITNAFDDLTPLPELNGSISASDSVTDYSGWFSWQNIIILVLILALLGFNIFVYLAKGTSDIASIFRNVFGPILSFFGLAAVDVTNQAIQGAAQGTAAVAATVSSASQSATDVVKGADSNSVINNSEPVQKQMQNSNQSWSKDSLSNALNDAERSLDVQPNSADSSLAVSGKSGWCYIGEENGVRTCAKVGVNDTCMSGNVFPSQDICINPSLRP